MKTTYPFISSNSSFTGCVRKDYAFRSSPNLFSITLQSNECEQDCKGRDLRNQQVILDSSLTHNFISCSWYGCTGTKGPAISFQSKTGSSLQVIQCSFDSCISSSTAREDGGGAINAYTVKSVSIISSFFRSCYCPNSGGAVLLHDVTDSPFVQFCTFLSCTAVGDAGGIGVYTCGNNLNSVAVQNCRFFSCHCDDSSGAYEYYNNTCRVCSSCLYCRCSATIGGALWIGFYRTYYSNEISFSLYHENDGNSGKDLHFSDAEKNVIFHCFTTSSGTDRVHTTKLITTTNYPNWLPHACN